MHFADAAVLLYKDAQLWSVAQQRGREIVNGRFERTIHGSMFWKRFEEVSGQLRDHRSANVMGRILEHHTLKSTEYMARWIEAKNRKP